MNAWLGQVSLRLVERGSALGSFRARPENIRQHEAFLGQATLQPSYQLGRPLPFRQMGESPKCCNSPDGAKYFDHSTGECVNTWNKGTPTDGEPSCIQNAQGDWIHPECSPPPAAPAQMEGRVRRIPIVNIQPQHRGYLGAWVKPLEPPPPSPTPAATTPEQRKLVACVNGPDLYDIYNPDMTLVAKAVLNPSTQYPDAQIDFAKFPPCPVPQATGVGGLCDVPIEYLAPKDPSGPAGKPVLACFTSQGVTLLDYATGAPVGTHLNASCLSLLSDVTRAQEGDPRCGAGSGPVATPPVPSPTPTPPPSPPTPPSDGTSSTSPVGGVMPTSGTSPIPATGQDGIVPVLPAPQQMTSASPPTGAFPGQPFAAMPPAQGPIPTAKAPAPLPPPCPLGPVPLRKWVEGCLG
jgi:hypothetical protein